MSTLPAIPNKRYFTIGEVSTLCAVKPHVLRYWEQEFQVLRPSKRRGNRRYYRLEDVVVVRQIKSLLYEQGYTISGARMQLITGITSATAIASKQQPILDQDPAPSVPDHNTEVSSPATPNPLIEQLEEVLRILG